MKCLTWAEEVPDDDPDEAMGRCQAIQSLPYAFRWAWREVVWARASEPPEADPCTFWSAKE